MDEKDTSNARKKKKGMPKRKLVKRSKQRGRYVRKDTSVLSREGERDVAECIFSDDEMREQFIAHNISGVSSVVTSDEPSSSHIEDFSEEQDSVDISGVLSPTTSVSCASSDVSDSSRPTSSLSSDLSRPTSACERRPESAMSSDAGTVQEQPEVDSCAPYIPPSDLIAVGLTELRSMLPTSWVPIADKAGFHLLLITEQTPKQIQRELFVTNLGHVSIFVHSVLISPSKEMLNLLSTPGLKFESDSIQNYCSNAVKIVRQLMQYNICVGANDMQTKHVWSHVPDTFIDTNPFQEELYEMTCRSNSCLWLVEVGGRGQMNRCVHCSKVLKGMKRRKEFLLSPSADISTRNTFLTSDQALLKIKQQKIEIKKKNKQIEYLKKRFEEVLEAEGVNIDENLNEDFSTILMGSNLSPVQKMFLQEQWSSANASDSRSHRWHPTMIRLALHLSMVSTAAYEALRDSGVVKLPSRRTLFDYSHAIAAQEGVSDGLIQLVHDRVHSLKNPYQKFHVLLCDGMHISRNLVLRKSDGGVIGYTHFDHVDKEMGVFENYLAGKEPVQREPELASEVVAYMVKGMASDVKCVVAAFPSSVVTKEMMYRRTWKVISALERADVKILALVCDAHPINRAFIAMHTPLTKTKSGVVFDTLNFCSPEERPLYFISDVCHLIKTARNCFYNSGEGEKKPRCMTINGEQIVWKHIIRLYFTYNNNTLRKSYKLNAQNVFPNSYSRMKVRYAAQVLSATVANDLESQKWPGTTETVRFIRYFNKFFDCLNGAFSTQHIRKKNADLAPYTHDDQRFEWLEGFLSYLENWKAQVEAMTLVADEKKRKCLAQQTQDGIEMSIKGFTGATKYFLSPEKCGGKFVMARVFSQDPLEQHFSRQRAGFGGSRNPNVSQFLQKQVSLAVQRDLGVRSRGSNVQDEQKGIKLTDEPLPKRKKQT